MAFESQRKLVIKVTSSDPFDVMSGVSQGSAMGLMLFLIYINDLPLEVVSP